MHACVVPADPWVLLVPVASLTSTHAAEQQDFEVVDAHQQSRASRTADSKAFTTLCQGTRDVSTPAVSAVQEDCKALVLRQLGQHIVTNLMYLADPFPVQTEGVAAEQAFAGCQEAAASAPLTVQARAQIKSRRLALPSTALQQADSVQQAAAAWAQSYIAACLNGVILLLA